MNRIRLLAVALLTGVVVVSPLGQAAAQQRRCRVAEIVLSPPEAEMALRETRPFVATAYDAAGIPCDVPPAFTFISSNPAVVTINRDGIATAAGAGTAVITARTGTGAAMRTSNRVQVTVGSGVVPQTVGRAQAGVLTALDFQPDGTGRPTSLLVDSLRKTLVLGEAWRPGYRAVKADGSNAEKVPLQFAVEPGGEGVVAVDSTGLIRAVDGGTATVRVQVTRPPGIPPRLIAVEVRDDSVTFRRAVISLAPGQTDTIPVWVRSLDRSFSNLAGTFQFTSSDPTKVRVNPDVPVVEALATGSAFIVAQSANYPELRARVNVHPPVQSIEVSADSLLMPLGTNQRVTVRALGADGRPVTVAPLSYRLTDSSVVSFDTQTGEVRARRVGTAALVVQAPAGRDSSITREVRLRVIAGGLRPSRAQVGLGVGEQAPVDVQLLDDQGRSAGSAMAMVTWTSSADSIAAFVDGRIVGRRPGRARLTARAEWDSAVTVDVAVSGDVLVSALREGRWDLYMLWNQNAFSMPLTRDSAIEGQAAWSPDLLRIAYIAAGIGPARTGSALFVTNVDGSRRWRITDDSATAQWPSWVRPDGRRLVFEWNKVGRPQIWMYEFTSESTGTLSQVTRSAGTNTAPSVAPDGRRIIFASVRESSPGRSSFGIWTAALDGSDERQVLTSSTRLDQPQYTADGQHILYLREEPGRPPMRRVWRLRVGAPPDSAVALTPPTLFVQSYSQNADGTRLALGVIEAGPRNTQIQRAFVFDLAGGQAAPLAPAPDERLASPTLRPAAQAPAAQPPASR